MKDMIYHVGIATVIIFFMFEDDMINVIFTSENITCMFSCEAHLVFHWWLQRLQKINGSIQSKSNQ